MRTTQDNVFMAYSDSMFAEETMGSVDELGHFALVEIGDKYDQIATLNDYQIDFDVHDDFAEPGWHIIEQTSGGFVWGTRYESEEEAREEWADIEEMYTTYYESEEDNA